STYPFSEAAEFQNAASMYCSSAVVYRFMLFCYTQFYVYGSVTMTHYTTIPRVCTEVISGNKGTQLVRYAPVTSAPISFMASIYKLTAAATSSLSRVRSAEQKTKRIVTLFFPCHCGSR